MWIKDYQNQQTFIKKNGLIANVRVLLFVT